jgi:hypothetical protein
LLLFALLMFYVIGRSESRVQTETLDDLRRLSWFSAGSAINLSLSSIFSTLFFLGS